MYDATTRKLESQGFERKPALVFSKAKTPTWNKVRRNIIIVMINQRKLKPDFSLASMSGQLRELRRFRS